MGKPWNDHFVDLPVEKASAQKSIPCDPSKYEGRAVVFDMETTKERIEYIRSLSEVDVYLQLLWALDELKELRDKLQSYEFEKKVEEDLKRLGH